MLCFPLLPPRDVNICLLLISHCKFKLLIRIIYLRNLFSFILFSSRLRSITAGSSAVTYCPSTTTTPDPALPVPRHTESEKIQIPISPLALTTNSPSPVLSVSLLILCADRPYSLRFFTLLASNIPLQCPPQ